MQRLRERERGMNLDFEVDGHGTMQKSIYRQQTSWNFFHNNKQNKLKFEIDTSTSFLGL